MDKQMHAQTKKCIIIWYPVESDKATGWMTMNVLTQVSQESQLQAPVLVPLQTVHSIYNEVKIAKTLQKHNDTVS